tara:strand:- start:332 stop:601 length:270 start_codon:yes stop_codon:yes gene_type:complete
MEPDYDHGDISIKRVANGWIVVSGSDVEEGQVTIFVYEDKENPNWIAESLYNLLLDQFAPYMQSKRSAGIKMSFSHKTKEEEDGDKETD